MHTCDIWNFHRCAYTQLSHHKSHICIHVTFINFIYVHIWHKMLPSLTFFNAIYGYIRCCVYVHICILSDVYICDFHMCTHMQQKRLRDFFQSDAWQKINPYLTSECRVEPEKRLTPILTSECRIGCVPNVHPPLPANKKNIHSLAQLSSELLSIARLLSQMSTQDGRTDNK